MDSAYARAVPWAPNSTAATRKHPPPAAPASTCSTLSPSASGRSSIHVDGPAWDAALGEVASKHPNWKVIIAHSGPGTPTLAAACLAERTPNVYLELCTSFPDLPTVREVVQRVGPHKLLFGTDAPLLDAAYALGLYARRWR